MIKNIISSLLFISFVFLNIAVAEDGSVEFDKRIQRAMPYGWKLGETTAKEIESKIPTNKNRGDGGYGTSFGNQYKVKHPIEIYLDTNNEGKLDFVQFYSYTSLEKLGVGVSATKSQVLSYLLNFFKRRDIITNGNKYKVYLSNDRVIEFYFYGDDNNYLELVIYYIENRQF